MKTQQKTFMILCAVLVGGAILQSVAKQEAATLGLSAFEFAILGVAAASLTSQFNRL